MKKRVLWLGIAAILVFGGVWKFCLQNTDCFDAEKILAGALLKERTFKNKAIEVRALDDSIGAYFMEEHSLPIVSMAFSFKKGGWAYEQKIGTALLAESTMKDGAGAYSRQKLRELMKEKGIKIGITAGRDDLSFSFSYLKEHEAEAIKVMKAVLYQPWFNPDDLALARRQLAAAYKQQFENPQYYLKQLVKDKFYGEHPYGRADIPDEKTLKAVSAYDIRGYLDRVYGRDNLFVGIAGDLSKDEAVNLLEQVFNKLPDKTKTGDLAVIEKEFSGEVTETEAPMSAQSFAVLVGKGIKRLDDDFYPFFAADYIFGGSGLNSRLNKAVREKEGLTYGIYSYMSQSDAVDLWQVSFSATPDNAEKALEIIREQYQAFYDKGVSETELDDAKRGLMASYNLRFASLFNIAEMLKVMAMEKLGIDFLEKRQEMVASIALDEVNRVIKERMPKPQEMMLFEANGVR